MERFPDYYDTGNFREPPNISELFTRTAQIHSCWFHTLFNNGKRSCKNIENKQQLFSFSSIGANIWNGIPIKVRELQKGPFKRKLKHMLLLILHTGEMNVDMRYLNLSKYVV